MTINPNYDVESLDVNKEVDEDGTATVALYNAQHGKTPRTGGPYLDDVEREQAEIRRAKVEGREPDLDNPPPTAGTVLVPKSMLVERDADKNHLSDTVEVTNEPEAYYQVPVEKTEPDPTQPDFDNDMSRLNALRAGREMEELKAQASPNLPSEQADAEKEKQEESVDTPQPDPNEGTSDDNPDNTEPVVNDTPDEPKWTSEEELKSEDNPNTRDV